ncbi:MAG: AAA family ATPase [Spirochaetia bacterium]|jgi:MoxR-like ATPase|nr:AAA family ATPase [Spirochaetia bacterium]
MKNIEEGKIKSVPEILEKLEKARSCFVRTIVDGDYLFNRLMTAYIAGGHILLEGVPGLAKTRAVKALAEIAGSDFSRIQFTPDLLPSDITGSMVFIPATGEFKVRKGPVFAGMVLADEINRSPAKVQSALLEAMEEHQVTIGDSTLKLPDNFFVIATQNPIEQDGTYRLPEAQTDRFLMRLDLDYPSARGEMEILDLHEKGEKTSPALFERLNPEDIASLAAAAGSVAVNEEIKKYIIDIVRETRKKNKYIEYGASPRASIGLMKCARIKAMLENRNWVLPEDVKELARDILRHRIIKSFEAEADGINSDAIIAAILGAVKTP